jgi:hypothetical protein
MTSSAQKFLIIGTAGVVALSGMSLLHSYKEAKASTLELNALAKDIRAIGEEMTKLRAQVEAYEKAKAAAGTTSTTTATAATPAPAATPAK